jgi:hypothetical protein
VTCDKVTGLKWAPLNVSTDRLEAGNKHEAQGHTGRVGPGTSTSPGVISLVAGPGVKQWCRRPPGIETPTGSGKW